MCEGDGDVMEVVRFSPSSTPIVTCQLVDLPGPVKLPKICEIPPSNYFPYLRHKTIPASAVPVAPKEEGLRRRPLQSSFEAWDFNQALRCTMLNGIVLRAPQLENLQPLATFAKDLSK